MRTAQSSLPVIFANKNAWKIPELGRVKRLKQLSLRSYDGTCALIRLYRLYFIFERKN